MHIKQRMHTKLNCIPNKYTLSCTFNSQQIFKTFKIISFHLCQQTQRGREESTALKLFKAMSEVTVTRITGSETERSSRFLQMGFVQPQRLQEIK